MFLQLTVLVSLALVASARPQHRFGTAPPAIESTITTGSTTPLNKNYKPNAFELEQNRAAKYEFASNIEDHISDLTNERTETRDGLKVKGSYSYSDGYYKRTVHYEADENGYRVTGQEAVPLQNGPQIDLTGTASVSNAAHGRTLAYRVQSVPVPGPVGKIID